MKIYDCFTYFDEKILLNFRLNYLSNYVDKFVISEANYTHSGSSKKLNFNINDYPKFKNKIIYIPVKKSPSNIKHPPQNFKRFNSIQRIAFQRNQILKIIKSTKFNQQTFTITATISSKLNTWLVVTNKSYYTVLSNNSCAR